MKPVMKWKLISTVVSLQIKQRGESYKGQAFPEFMQKIIKAEGLMNYINAKEA